jgi:hypothetical protein
MKKFVEIVDDEVSMEILRICKEPRTTEEIINLSFESLNRKFPAYYGKKSGIPRIIAPRLSKLEDADALRFSNNKWQTTSFAISTLSKYFAITLTSQESQ